MYGPVVLNAFLMLCSHRHHPPLECFHILSSPVCPLMAGSLGALFSAHLLRKHLPTAVPWLSRAPECGKSSPLCAGDQQKGPLHAPGWGTCLSSGAGPGHEALCPPCCGWMFPAPARHTLTFPYFLLLHFTAPILFILLGILLFPLPFPFLPALSGWCYLAAVPVT